MLTRLFTHQHLQDFRAQRGIAVVTITQPQRDLDAQMHRSLFQLSEREPYSSTVKFAFMMDPHQLDTTFEQRLAAARAYANRGAGMVFFDLGTTPLMLKYSIQEYPITIVFKNHHFQEHNTNVEAIEQLVIAASL